METWTLHLKQLKPILNLGHQALTDYRGNIVGSIFVHICSFPHVVSYDRFTTHLSATSVFSISFMDKAPVLMDQICHMLCRFWKVRKPCYMYLKARLFKLQIRDKSSTNKIDIYT